MSVDATRESIEAALEAARQAKGATLLVLISPKQAERLFTAMRLADKMRDGDLEGCTALLVRYEELSK